MVTCCEVCSSVTFTQQWKSVVHRDYCSVKYRIIFKNYICNNFHCRYNFSFISFLEIILSYQWRKSVSLLLRHGVRINFHCIKQRNKNVLKWIYSTLLLHPTDGMFDYTLNFTELCTKKQFTVQHKQCLQQQLQCHQTASMTFFSESFKIHCGQLSPFLQLQ